MSNVSNAVNAFQMSTLILFQATDTDTKIMSSIENTSTLKSYVASATDTIQSGVASLTGTASDHVCFVPPLPPPILHSPPKAFPHQY
jgi:hypothetical protein